MAIIDPAKLDDALEAVRRFGAPAPIVTEARNYQRRGRTEVYRGAEYTPRFTPMIKIEIDVSTADIEPFVDALAAAARSDQFGEAEVSVHCVESYLRLQRIDGEQGPRRAA
ncbi:MAG TPA: P-II family nitrogen regulator, partial [Methylocystis sp.]|nr:P-II family nitrogen regulator [Methylocystis sp.]